MKTLKLLLITTLLIAGVSNASEINCKVDRLGKNFLIGKSVVSINSFDEFNGRNIASANTVRTRSRGNGFDKILNYEGHKYTLHVENSSEFSEVDDYLVIRSREGHEITYPMSCTTK